MEKYLDFETTRQVLAKIKPKWKLAYMKDGHGIVFSPNGDESEKDAYFIVSFGIPRHSDYCSLLRHIMQKSMSDKEYAYYTKAILPHGHEDDPTELSAAVYYIMNTDTDHASDIAELFHNRISIFKNMFESNVKKAAYIYHHQFELCDRVFKTDISAWPQIYNDLNRHTYPEMFLDIKPDWWVEPETPRLVTYEDFVSFDRQKYSDSCIVLSNSKQHHIWETMKMIMKAVGEKELDRYRLTSSKYMSEGNVKTNEEFEVWWEQTGKYIQRDYQPHNKQL